jgi:hypothetical protein
VTTSMYLSQRLPTWRSCQTRRNRCADGVEAGVRERCDLPQCHMQRICGIREPYNVPQFYAGRRVARLTAILYTV